MKESTSVFARVDLKLWDSNLIQTETEEQQKPKPQNFKSHFSGDVMKLLKNQGADATIPTLRDACGRV